MGKFSHCIFRLDKTLLMMTIDDFIMSSWSKAHAAVSKRKDRAGFTSCLCSEPQEQAKQVGMNQTPSDTMTWTTSGNRLLVVMLMGTLMRSVDLERVISYKPRLQSGKHISRSWGGSWVRALGYPKPMLEILHPSAHHPSFHGVHLFLQALKRLALALVKVRFPRRVEKI